MRIAVAGKGGTGKTTLSALLVIGLVERGLGPILAVDADPNDNLGAALGIPVNRTLGAIREDFIQKRPDIPPGMTKGALLEMRLHQAVIESRGVDLLVMGRPEGPGCYCFVNNLLRKSIEELSKNYRVVVIDNEAGMEHLSRKIVGKVDLLLLVSDHSVKGVGTAARLKKLADEMTIPVGRTHLVVNRVGEGGVSAAVKREAEASGLVPFGVLPEDDAVSAAYRDDTPIARIADSPYGRAASRLIDDIVLQETA